MMATAGTPSSSSFLPLLESLEDDAAGQSEQTDAYLTIANRLSGEEGRQLLPAVEKHFSRFGKATLAHITSSNAELSQAALQALGFCVYHARVVSGVPETFIAEILSTLCSLVVKSTDKNTCTRALWVISKQNFPLDVVAKKVTSILDTLESVWSREDIQSVVMEHEALNVIIRMLEQMPDQMADGAVRWAKLVIPLVVHSASKVRLRAAAAMEMGMPLLLEKQSEVAAIIEPMMSSKLVPELQKLFMAKNETNVLKLWPLFVKLLGKLLHRGGPFINSLLHLEELGFRSSSPSIKKIAFIAWKSLIDNFALNPDILCSSKRIKLLMQPLVSIHVRTEALLLTKVEVWWNLVVKLGPNLSSNFDQVSVPLLQHTIGSDSSSAPGPPSRAVSQNGAVPPGTPGFNSPASISRMSLNSSVQSPSSFPSIQLLGLEMLLHFFLGPEVVAIAAKNKLILSLEPLNHQLLTGASSFTKHAAVLTSSIRDGLANIGKNAPESLLEILWTSLVRFVTLTIESAGSKKDRHGCEVLTLMLQALQSIVASDDMPADRVLILFEATVKGIPHRVLGSASYQVGKMDVLNGTPALYLLLLLYNSSTLSAYMEDERFFQCLQMLVACGLSGPTSPLAFGEAVLAAVGRNAGCVQNKEQLWRTWSVVVSLLTDTIIQSNEVNQGDALEHNFGAMHSALLFPIMHLLRGAPLQQVTHKLMLSMWSKLYKVFARCSGLVVTAEENICCEEFCTKMMVVINTDALKVPSTLNMVTSILQVMVECVDFSPYTPQFQHKLKSPCTPVNWTKRRNKVLGNLSTFQALLVQCLQVYLEDPEAAAEAPGLALVSILSTLFTNLGLANTIKEFLTSLIQPLALFSKQAASEPHKFSQQLLGKLEKLLVDVLGCLQTRPALVYDNVLLGLLCPLLCVLFPHKKKQLRTSAAQFWNSTFANSVSLAYPDEIRSILSQVKQKTPIILPGFEAVGVPDELSGQYSSEGSQLETKLSGMPVSSAGKRDSVLEKAADLMDKSSMKTSKPVSTKLDFGSPKPPRREVLEEEASIDFIFIPPETKERVLTEHQKEVKRTKRVDIPAMYNNLDASLDTTVFTQYTQSQEDSQDKLPTEQADKVPEEAPGKIPLADVLKEEDADILSKETQDYVSPNALENMPENSDRELMIPESADVSAEYDAKSNVSAEDLDLESKEGSSSNVSPLDLISGTPQKPNSRRQSFVTLEKYDDGKCASPSTASMFTGPLIKTTCNQEHSNTNKTSSSLTLFTSTGPNSQDSQSSRTRKDTPESPLRPDDSGKKCEPVRLIERMSSDVTEVEDVIPDTQTEVKEEEGAKKASALEELNPSSQEEEPMDYSKSSKSSPDEPRRSGRQRVRPLLPGEDPEERAEKYKQLKRRRSGEEPKAGSPMASDSGPRTRSKQAAEDSGRLRTRAQRDRRQSSQTNFQGRAHKKLKLYSNSDEFLGKPEPRKRSTRESSQNDLQSDSQFDYESQSKGRSVRRSKSSLDTKKEDGMKKKVQANKEESSQKASQKLGLLEQIMIDEDKPREGSQIIATAPHSNGASQDLELVEQTEKDDEEPREDSRMVISPQTGSHSEELELNEKTHQEKDSNSVTTSPKNYESQDGTDPLNQVVKKSKVRDETRESTDDNLSQENSQTITASSDSQTLRRSRRSKTSEATEAEDKSENKGLSERQSRSSSQPALSAVGHVEASIGSRTRRSKVQGAQPSAVSPSESSQSLNNSGRWRTYQLLEVNGESLESESSESRENTPVPNKRGKKLRVSLQSPPTLESKDLMKNHMVENDFDSSQNRITEGLEAKTAVCLDNSVNNQDLQVSELLQMLPNIEAPKSMSQTGSDAVEEEIEEVNPNESTCQSGSPRKHEPPQDFNVCLSSGQECDSQSADMLGPVITEPTQGMLPSDLAPVDTPSYTSAETTQASETTEQKAEEMSEPDESVTEKLNHNSNHHEHPVVPAEVSYSFSFEQDQMETSKVIADLSREEGQSAVSEDGNQNTGTNNGVTHQQESDDKVQTVEGHKEDEPQPINTENNVANPDAASPELKSKDDVQSSPAKQKDLESIIGPDLDQSPSGGRTRGIWSPSASPSTSILKKGPKRLQEEEASSPPFKSRRVSFADPIQQQETADDIDRRSPAVRTSSPRRPKLCSIPQPKYVTTPTKGLLVLSPRNLHSPGFKSSKKCLISEMSQEARPISSDCIYPALVGCSTPVEAVLSHISSNMWSRGFGQLVRARNIKTVGDLSALTASEIKTLPIRSPKISNVKRALKVYEQRKGRGGDELRASEGMEVMASELQSCAAHSQEEKASTEMLATELLDEHVPADGRPEQATPMYKKLATPENEKQAAPANRGAPAEEQSSEGRLLSELDALSCNWIPVELSRCSPQQLVQIHERLGGLMRSVVMELQSRL